MPVTGFEVSSLVLCFFCPSLFQMEELKSSHEAMKQELENQHTEQLQRVREQCDLSLQGQ